MRKMNSNTLKGAAAVALAAVLAGCQMMGPPPQRAPIQVQPQQQASIDGEWLSTDGVATSRFFGGTFETIANDTGNRISEGRYQSRGGNVYEISGMSLIRQSPIAFNCMMITPTQLNCTAEGGNQFSLVRRA